MRRINLSILLFFFSLTYGINAQEVSLKDFKISLRNSSSDSVFKTIDERLLKLKVEVLNDSVIVQNLKFKLYVADSLNSKMAKHFALIELLKYPNYSTQKEYFYYLMKEGDIQINIGGLNVTMDYHFKAAGIAESFKNDTLLFKVYKRIGVNYMKSDDFSLSLKYLLKAKIIAVNLKDLQKEASCYMSIGNNYKDKLMFERAMFNYNKSIELSKKIDWERGLAGNYNNIGNVYRKKKEFNTSLKYLFLAENMNIKSGNKEWLSYNYNNIGNIYEDKENYQLALKYFKKSQKIKENLNDKYGQLASLENISMTYGKLKDYKNAFKYLQDFILLNDNLIKKSKLNLIVEIEAKFENEKNKVEINKLKAEQNLQDIVIEGQKRDLLFQEKIRYKEMNLRIAFGVILLSLLSIVFIFWKNAKQRKKFLIEITESKKVLNIKNKGITDSINYAKRIQNAILPSTALIKSNLSKSFIMYIPKDIVAGDFYWMKKINQTVLFAVADCTGHGVPGALVSVVCNNALNTAVDQGDSIEPGLILDKTTAIVQHQFSKTDELVRDGMDIALCALDMNSMKLNYSGANNPLWLVRKGELTEYKATRQPVGNYENLVDFETNEIQLLKGDMIYLSTDGFSDQFGGDKGKKFMKKNVKDLLVVVSKIPIDKQEEKLREVFNEWLSDYDQVDDVCVMGIQI